MTSEPVADDRARVDALTEDESRALTDAITYDDLHGGDRATFETVERILAQRAAPDPRIEKVRAALDDAMTRGGSNRWVASTVAHIRAALDGDPI